MGRFLWFALACSCSSGPPAPPKHVPPPPPVVVAPPAEPPADFAVEVSSGGGFTGSYTVVGMRAGGQTFAKETGRFGRSVEGPVMAPEDRAKLWRLLSGSKPLGCKPGNMTTGVSVTADGKQFQACAPEGEGSAAEGLAREVSGYFMAAARALEEAPPPVPLPDTLTFDLVRDSRSYHLARGPKGLDDATAQSLWELFLRARVSWLEPEILNGKRLEKPKKGCPKGRVFLRVRADTKSKTPFNVRQGCSYATPPSPNEVALFEAIEQAAKR